MKGLMQAFDEIEKKMLYNLANSYFQLHFHENGTPEELQKYYGWEEAFREEERVKLVEDTRKRIESEEFVLAYYQRNKAKIKAYGNKNTKGNSYSAAKRPSGGRAQQGSVDSGTGENA
jgi:hypothetical protein